MDEAQRSRISWGRTYLRLALGGASLNGPLGAARYEVESRSREELIDFFAGILFGIEDLKSRVAGEILGAELVSAKKAVELFRKKPSSLKKRPLAGNIQHLASKSRLFPCKWGWKKTKPFKHLASGRKLNHVRA